MSQAYYLKYRPQNWDDVLGQRHVVDTLRHALSAGHTAHAYLFAGPRGTGKTTTARLLAKAVNCLVEDLEKRPCGTCEYCLAVNEGRFMDLIEIDAASNTSVEDVRDLRDKINFSPSQGRYKVYIIDEVHMLSNAAFNALLKTLEEPPAHAIFILATTEVHKIPATVLSRCQRHEFRKIPLAVIGTQLKKISVEESIDIEKEAIITISRQATGSLRDAVSLLDQLASSGKKVTLQQAKDVLGTSAQQNVYEFIQALIHKDLGMSISLINSAVDAGSDPRQFAKQIVDSLRDILVFKIGQEKQLNLTKDEQDRIHSFSQKLDAKFLVDAIRVFDEATQRSDAGWQPSLQLELAAASVLQHEVEKTTDSSSKKKESSGKNQPKKENVENSQGDIIRKKIPKKDIKEKNKTPQTKAPSVDQASEKEPPIPDDVKKEIPADQSISSTDKGNDDLVMQHWKEIQKAAKQLSPETAALLNSSKSVKMHKGKMILGFSSEILRSKMESEKNITHAQNAIEHVIGLQIQIICEVVRKGLSQSNKDLDISQDSIIGTAISLGGKLSRKDFEN